MHYLSDIRVADLRVADLRGFWSCPAFMQQRSELGPSSALSRSSGQWLLIWYLTQSTKRVSFR